MTDSGLKHIKKGVSRGSRKARTTGFVMILISGGLLFFLTSSTGGRLSSGELIWAWIFYGLFFGAGVVSVIVSYEHLFFKKPILKAIESCEQDFIVWYYPNTTNSGNYSVYAYNNQGKLIQIRSVRKNEEEVLACLKTHFPNAKNIFKEEYKKILRQNPRELLRPNPTLK